MDRSGVSLSSTGPLKEYIREAHSERVKALMDNRVGVVSAMALMVLHLTLDVIIPKNVEGGSPGYLNVAKVVLGSLAVLVLGDMLLKSKLKDQQPS